MSPIFAGAPRRAAGFALAALCGCGHPAPPPAPPPLPVLSAPVERPNTPPSLSVSGNAPDGIATYGATVALTARCDDREDGRLTGIHWTNGPGELLGAGAELRLMPEPGEYVLLATCSDLAGTATTVAASPRFEIIDRWSAADSVPVLVRLPYATTRGGSITPRSPGRSFDGTARDSLARGLLTVNVPSGDFRATGSAVRTPYMRSVRGNVASDDARRLSLRAIDATDSSAFARQLAQGLSEGVREERLVFVHGYRTSFESAAVRAARLAAEVQFPGATILFAWSSNAQLASYRSDQRAARDAGRQLAALLRELRADPGTSDLSIVSHSMGAEVLAAALRTLHEADSEAGATRMPPVMFREVVLVAPDLAAGAFLEQVLPALSARAARVTIYASAADFALWSSWGSNGERRLGLGGRFATLARGVETIEVPYSATDALGHNPFTAPPFRDDLHGLLVQHLPAALRSLREIRRDDGTIVWQLP